MQLLRRHKSFSRVKLQNLSVAAWQGRRDHRVMTNLSKPILSRPHDPEPSLAELLNDSVLQWLLVSDRIDRNELEAVIRRAQRRLWPTAPQEASLADCLGCA